MAPVARPIVLVLRFLFCVAVLGQTVVAAEPTFDPMRTARMRSDARLNDVCFVSPTTGWAVGDRGTIWHTSDAGRHWQLQRSNVGCSLESVWFVDEQNGWAAGGRSHPYGSGSAGVLLRTENGGKSWQPLSRLTLPKIRKIRFFDHKVGFAVGDGSAMFPSGVFVTQTAGFDWRAIHGNHRDGWCAGDLVDPTTGALAGRQGAVAAVRNGAIDTERSPNFGLRTLRAVQLVRPTWGWLAGDGALIMLTGDLGITWESTPGELPPGVFENFDFAALAVRGPKCWVAGSPGTRVLRTDDAGKTWTASPTGQNVPIRAITFVDGQHGWAVGALGTILATDDGGQTWRRQRSGGTRAALLGLFGRPADVPLELFVQLSGNDGYLGVVDVLNRPDPGSPARASGSLEDRLGEAVVGLGASDASLAWRFPLRDDQLELADEGVLDDWNRANDGRGMEVLQAHLVRRIRLWRPEVVVTHGAAFGRENARQNLVHRAVLEAVRAAADPTRYVDQIAGAGLEPWQVKKVYGTQYGGGDGTTNVNEASIAQRLGRSLGEVAADARGLLAGQFTPGPETIGFHLIVDETGQGGESGGLFGRIALAPGGEARRQLADPPAGSLAALEQAAKRRRNIRAIVRRSPAGSLAGRQLLAHAGELTRGMDQAGAGRVLYLLASQYQARGQWPLAAETFEALADRYPEHPLAGEALAWLVQYYSSLEAAWRVQGVQRKTKHGVDKPATSTLAINQSLAVDRPARAAEFARRLKQTRPDLFDEPQVRFPLVVADRMRGLPSQAERYLMSQRRREQHDAWWSCAAGEAWLVEPVGKAPKPIVRCVRTATKPKLDGRLDEPCWKRAKGAPMTTVDDSARAVRPAILRLAYDEAFLYVACQGTRHSGVDYSQRPGPRPRDADLSGRDRVDLLLDINRDYVSYYRLGFDASGWTREDCWGDATWNPTWFVAAEEDGDTWTVEAAIPLDQLTGRYPGPGQAWALGAQRIVPGVGLQSWNTPAAPDAVPQGFGYLVFE